MTPRGSDLDGHIEVPLLLLDGGTTPGYAKPGDAGADLSSAEDLVLAPGARALVRTGVAVAIPPGCAGLVHPRSGLAARHGISIVNAPGTVDSGYRGEILVNLVNLGSEMFQVRAGDRIAQLLVVPVLHAEFIAVDSLPRSERGETGHGSSGGFAAHGPDPADASTSPQRRETD
ncbi:MAG: dUTP diphosphatase [Dermatophilaceae bacterium]